MDYLEEIGEAPVIRQVLSLGLGLSAAYLASYWLNPLLLIIGTTTPSLIPIHNLIMPTPSHHSPQRLAEHQHHPGSSSVIGEACRTRNRGRGAGAFR